MRIQFGLLISVSLLAACASGDSTSSTPPPASTVPDGDALSAAYDSVHNEDGTWNLDTVLSIFAARNGDLPGVEPADEPTASILDDQAVADVLSQRLDDLVPEIRSVVEAWLFPGSAEETHTYLLNDGEVVEMIDGVKVPVEVPTPGEPDGTTLAPDDDPIPTLDTLAPDPTGGPTRAPHGVPAPQLILQALFLLNAYQVLSDVTLTNFELRIERGPTPPGAGAEAQPYVGEPRCKIRISSNREVRRTSLAHEVYHCFQYGVRVQLGLHPSDAPAWVIEGTATYAAESVHPGHVDDFLTTWASGPMRPLSGRSYDAVGFYQTVQEASGSEVWLLMVKLLSTDDPASVLTRELRTSHYAHWGAQDHDNRALGPAFYFHRFPGLGRRVEDRSVLLGGPTITLAVPAMSSRAFSVTGTWNDGVLVVEPTVSGVLKVGELYVRGFTPGTTARLCFSGVSCTPCPGVPAIIPTRVQNDSAVIGAASVGGGEIRVRLVSREQLCGPCPEAGPARADHSGNSASAGAIAPRAPICEPETTVPVGGAACVVGTWLVDNAVMARAFQAITSVPGAPPGNQIVTGTFSMKVNADGTITVNATNWTTASEQEGPAGTPPILFESVFNGTTNGTWTADATTFTARTTGNFGGQAFVTIGGARTEVTGAQLPNLPVGTGTSNYVCTPEGGLVLRARAPGAVDVTFTRSG